MNINIMHSHKLMNRDKLLNLKNDQGLYIFKKYINNKINCNSVAEISKDILYHNNLEYYMIKFDIMNGYIPWVFEKEEDRDKCFDEISEKIKFIDILNEN